MHVIVQRSSGPTLRAIVGGKALNEVAEARMAGMEALASRGRRRSSLMHCSEVVVNSLFDPHRSEEQRGNLHQKPWPNPEPPSQLSHRSCAKARRMSRDLLA